MNKPTLTLHNTRTNQTEEFHPRDPKKVGVYTCGPTVYAYPHIGNMRAYIFADTLRRVLEFMKFPVQHVMNITDVGHLTDDADDGQDKLEVGAKKEGLTVWQVAEKYTKFFFEETASLNIKKPHVVCKATDYIAEQISMVEALEKNGFTYVTSDGVYFDTAKFPRYADFARLDVKGLEAGSRIEMGEKRNKTDFALWKFSQPEDKRAMEWDAPWGRGFPGWHIECSAMASHFLGKQFDIHTGGVDHIPIHHTNEIAQSECATGCSPFANVWMHSEFLILDDGAKKMSKSLGNIITVRELAQEGIPPLAFRYLCLTTHYRKQLQFSKEGLKAALRAYERLNHLREKLTESAKPVAASGFQKRAQEYAEKLLQAMATDLNTAQVLANLWLMLDDENVSDGEKLTLIDQHNEILGLSGESQWTAAEIPAEVTQLMSDRTKYRTEKNWAMADKVRDRLAELGYEVADSPNGPVAQKIVLK